MTNIMLFAAGSSNAALWTFLIYMLAVFSLAVFSNKLLKGKNFLSEYFLGSRGLGVWAFALTFAATSASGGSFTGFTPMDGCWDSGLAVISLSPFVRWDCLVNESTRLPVFLPRSRCLISYEIDFAAFPSDSLPSL